MPSPIDHFDLRTIALEDTKVSVHCYRGLGAFRVDGFAPNAFEGIEVWSIMILHNKTLFPVVPAFHTIDETIGAIWDLSTLLPWERPFTTPMLKSALGPISQVLSHYKAFPFGPVMRKHLTASERARFIVPIPDETVQ